MTDLYEFPDTHSGARRYVSVRGHDKSIPAYKTYKGTDGYNYVLPEYGGDWKGYENYSTAVQFPMYIKDMGEYVSPIDGTHITSRSAHRDHMRTHDVIEVGNERMPTPRPDTPVMDTEESARAIKAYLDQVDAMPQREYDNMVATRLENLPVLED